MCDICPRHRPDPDPLDDLLVLALLLVLAAIAYLVISGA